MLRACCWAALAALASKVLGRGVRKTAKTGRVRLAPRSGAVGQATEDLVEDRTQDQRLVLARYQRRERAQVQSARRGWLGDGHRGGEPLAPAGADRQAGLAGARHRTAR